MRRLLVFAAACGSSQTVATPDKHIENAAPAISPGVNPVCPESVRDHVWSRELFPGCSPKPFWLPGVTCAGDCPTPCRSVTLDSVKGGTKASVHRYDARGRWASTVTGWSVGKYMGEGEIADELPPGGKHCTRNGREGTCGVISERMGDGQLVPQASVRFDEAGNVLSIKVLDSKASAIELVWAGGHQLVEEREPRPGGSARTYRYEYDTRGRLSRVSSSGWGDTQDAHYTYDETHGLLSKIATDYSASGHHELTFEYDAKRRPIRVKLVTGKTPSDGMTIENIYTYECVAPRPFAEAVPVMEAFRAKACACVDHECSAKVVAELEAWRTGVSDPIGFRDDPDLKAGAAFRKLDDELTACLR